MAQFSKADAERVAQVVPWAERQMRNRPGRRARWPITRSKIVFGKLDGVLNQGSSVLMSVWADDPLADTGQNITVYDWFLEAVGSLASGTKCKAEMYSGKWYVTTAECPV